MNNEAMNKVSVMLFKTTKHVEASGHLDYSDFLTLLHLNPSHRSLGLFGRLLQLGLGRFLVCPVRCTSLTCSVLLKSAKLAFVIM